MRIWRHLKMLKRAGRGQDPSGAEGTQEGELAIECPACPHPGRNLPDGWENAPQEIRYANFHLRLIIRVLMYPTGGSTRSICLPMRTISVR